MAPRITPARGWAPTRSTDCSASAACSRPIVRSIPNWGGRWVSRSPPRCLAAGSDRRARLDNEARLLAASIIRTSPRSTGLLEADGVAGWCSSWVEGASAGGTVDRGTAAGDEALSASHSDRRRAGRHSRKGIVHRDLKPANIKITLETASSRYWTSAWRRSSARGPVTRTGPPPIPTSGR